MLVIRLRGLRASLYTIKCEWEPPYCRKLQDYNRGTEDGITLLADHTHSHTRACTQTHTHNGLLQEGYVLVGIRLMEKVRRKVVVEILICKVISCLVKLFSLELHISTFLSII